MHLLGLVLFSIVFIGTYFWVQSKPKSERQLAGIKAALLIVGVFILFLALTGKLHWVAALIGAVLPFLIKVGKFIPFLTRILPFLKTGSVSTENLNSPYLELSVDRAKNQVNGKVLKGEFTGQSLGYLTSDELDALSKELQGNDPKGAVLLDFFIDFQTKAQAYKQQTAPSQQSMSREEALEILGLEANATNDDIETAHKRLIQKMHPDRGGSDYLAARINAAKDTLLH